MRRLVIVGDGFQRRSLERLAGGQVAFTGFRHDVKDLYQALDLFVCPSRYEPFGRVIAEALDAGVPVVAADAQGPVDIARTRSDRAGAARRRGATRGGASGATRPQGRVRVECDMSGFSVARTG